MEEKIKLEKWITRHPKLWGTIISICFLALAFLSGVDVGRYFWIAIVLSAFFGGLYFACYVGIKVLKNRQ
jgi:hypothetical protein